MNVRDQLNSATSQQAQAVAFLLLDKLQENPGQLVAGAALLFDLVVRRFGIDPREALAQADRRIADALKDPQQRAISQYLKEEL
jgi:hypothetical protein